MDDRLAWFSIGALCAFVICGWPWHPRFSRYERLRRGSNPPPPGGKPTPPPGPPSVDLRAALARQESAGPTNGEGMPCDLIRTLLRPGYEPGDGSADGAQLVNLAWWHPAMGCDSLQIVVDNARARCSFGLERCQRLQQENHRFREPERTILCDILANGTLLPDPNGTRYARPDVAPVATSEHPTPVRPQPTGGRLIRGDRWPG